MNKKNSSGRKKPFSTVRPTTKKKSRISTDSHTLVSIGKNDLKVLRYMSKLENRRFNRNHYSRTTGIPRSTIKDSINRLLLRGYIKNPSYGNYFITENGAGVVEQLSGEVGAVRRESRDARINLSSHNLQFKFEIQDRRKFSKDLIKKLNPIDIGENNLNNLRQIIVYFEEATVLVNPKKLIVCIHDVLDVDTDSSSLRSIDLAIKYCRMFISIGVDVSNLMIETGHYARIESLLAGFLEKIDNRYFLDLGEGKKLWIDNSTGPLEDETNSKEVRERVDNFMDDMIKSNGKVSDIDKMREVVGGLVGLRVADFKRDSGNYQKGGLPSYFG